MRIAEVHEARKDPEAAIGALKKALKDTRDYVPAQVGLIRLYVKSGKEAEAIAIAREMQAQRPKAPIGYLSEGEIASAKKSWDDAINVYQRGFKQTGAVNLGIRLFVTLVTAGRQAEADKVLADWLKENPKDQAFRQAAAEMAIVRGQYAVAATHLRAVLELAPENAGVLNNLAMLTSALKQPGAIDLAEKANRIAPNQPTIMDTLGTLLADQGEYERAISLVGKAAKAAPDNSAIRLNFVLVLVKAGKKEDAKKELDALAKLGDKFSGQAQVAKMLREL